MYIGNTLDGVKQSLRISSDDYNTELVELIASCVQDLRLAGVNVDRIFLNGSYNSFKIISEKRNDKGKFQSKVIMSQAIIFYAKANFGFRDDSEKYREAYENLKRVLTFTYPRKNNTTGKKGKK